jgi:serine/threonine protein kinase
MAVSLDHPQAGSRLDNDPDVRSFVFGLIRASRRDTPFDAAQVLARHPELAQIPSAVLEFAVEEYDRRRRAGESISIQEFAVRFPECEDRLRSELNLLYWAERDERVSQVLNESYFPEPGDTFLGYALLELLGCGNCSRVYVAREPELGGRKVVVKLCIDAAREADTLGRLEHDGIVPVHSIRRHADSSLVALCMPYLTRTTLHHILVRTFADGHPPVTAGDLIDAVGAVNGDHVPPGPLRHPPRWWSRHTYVDAIVDVGVQIAETLAFVHARGACHGDLKPSNVLVTGGGRSLLLDFNMSSWATRDGALGGTLPYMAPEQIEQLLETAEGQQPARWNPQADLFGLAATLYQLLTGRLPFGPVPECERLADQAAEMLERHRRAVVPPGAYNPRISARMSRLIVRGLAADPSVRPQSAEELAGALRGHFAPRRRTVRWIRRHWVQSLGGAGIAVAAAVAVGRTGFSSDADLRRDRITPPSVHAASYSLGVEAIQRQDHAEGIAHLDDVLADQPEHLDARFARGQARLMLGEDLLRQADELLASGQRDSARERGNSGWSWIDLAREDFEVVIGHRPEPIVKACLGYCRLRRRNPSDDAVTIQLLCEGICPEFPPEAAWNNVGRLQIDARQYEAARRSLEIAVQHNDRCGAAHYNLALTWFLLASRTAPPTQVDGLTRQTCVEQALSSVERAIELGFEDEELHLTRVLMLVDRAVDDATRVQSGGGPVDEARQPVFDAVKAGVRAGLDPRRFMPALSRLPGFREDPRLQNILESRGPRPAARNLVLRVNPLAGQPLPIRFL